MKKNIYIYIYVYIYIYICITESLCCTAEIKHNKVNQLYFNKIKKQKDYKLLKERNHGFLLIYLFYTQCSTWSRVST